MEHDQLSTPSKLRYILSSRAGSVPCFYLIFSGGTKVAQSTQQQQFLYAFIQQLGVVVELKLDLFIEKCISHSLACICVFNVDRRRKKLAFCPWNWLIWAPEKNKIRSVFPFSSGFEWLHQNSIQFNSISNRTRSERWSTFSDLKEVPRLTAFWGLKSCHYRWSDSSLVAWNFKMTSSNRRLNGCGDNRRNQLYSHEWPAAGDIFSGARWNFVITLMQKYC